MKPTYEELQTERNALAAQVEVLKDAANSAWCNWRSSSDVFGGMQKLIAAIEATPTTCLARVKAEAGRAGYKLGAEEWCFNQNEMQIDIERSANQYAERIRQGVV